MSDDAIDKKLRSYVAARVARGISAGHTAADMHDSCLAASVAHESLSYEDARRIAVRVVGGKAARAAGVRSRESATGTLVPCEEVGGAVFTGKAAEFLMKDGPQGSDIPCRDTDGSVALALAP